MLLLQESYRTAILTEHMIKDLVINLSRDNEELKMHCALAIFKVTVWLVAALQRYSDKKEQK